MLYHIRLVFIRRDRYIFINVYPYMVLNGDSIRGQLLLPITCVCRVYVTL